MIAVEISGWRKGCNSVAAIKEIRSRAGIPLNEALALVNRVINNEKVAVCVPCPNDASQLVDELARVGMIAQVSSNSFTQTLVPSQRPQADDMASPSAR